MTKLAIAAGCALVIGAILTVRGWCGPRIDDHPRCRRCRYDLSGIDDPQTCPECGRALTRRRAVRHGRRRRRRVVLVFGVLLLLLGATGGGMVGVDRAKSIEWDPHKPTWWLTSDLRNGRLRAWNELRRRQNHDALSVDQTVTLVGIARDQIALAPWNPLNEYGPLAFIEQAWIDGHADDGDLDTTLSRLPVSLTVQRSGRTGGSLGYSMFVRRSARVESLLQLATTLDRVTIDDQPVRHWHGLCGITDAMEEGGVVFIPEDVSGAHVVTFHLLVTVMPQDQAADRRWTFSRTTSRRVQIDWFPEEHIDEVDAELWPAKFWPQRLASGRLWRDEYGLLRPPTSTWGSTPPAPNVAFDVFWRVGDREFKVESFTYSVAGRTKQQYFLALLDDFDPSITHVDVIYRSNRDLANMHAGLETMWVGELRWENVEVVWPE